MADDYAPFPRAELLEYAAATPVKALAAHLHNAVKCYEALNERCLLAELSRDQANAVIARFQSMLTETNATILVGEADRAA